MIIGWQAQRIGNLYGAFICFGIATLFGLQVIINLGVNTGLLPTKGLTLPFFSYGGSSLLICCVMVALVYRVSIEIDSPAVKKESKKTSKKVPAKKSVAGKLATKTTDVDLGTENSINFDEPDEYITGFDAYVEELSGGRDDK
jgi:cell division protein FtsW